ncbi:MAG: hypothetical protein RSC10_08810 [Longicatena sp.]
MTLMEETLEDSWDIWQQYMKHPFIEDIRKNKMDEEMFCHYLVEDTIYLKAYARVFGMGIYKSKTMEEIRLFYDMLKFVESDENVARVKLLATMGIDVKDIENREPTAENKAYTDFMLKIAQEEGPLEMIFATLPCMLSYAYIGEELVKENPSIVEENTYGTWIQEYVAKEYIDKCDEWASIALDMSESISKEKKKHLKDIFRTASEHELSFWNMSYKKNESRGK